MNWSREQLGEIEHAIKTIEPAYLRARALAVWHVQQGQSYRRIAQCLNTTRQSVGKWVRDYHRHGLEGLRIRKGRGRKPILSHDDVGDYVAQSPRNFGLNRTRWTLTLLGNNVPSLNGLTPSAIYRILQRLGISYKRGQPHLRSPDPEYLEKKRESGRW